MTQGGCIWLERVLSLQNKQTYGTTRTGLVKNCVVESKSDVICYDACFDSLIMNEALLYPVQHVIMMFLRKQTRNAVAHPKSYIHS